MHGPNVAVLGVGLVDRRVLDPGGSAAGRADTTLVQMGRADVVVRTTRPVDVPLEVGDDGPQPGAGPPVVCSFGQGVLAVVTPAALEVSTAGTTRRRVRVVPPRVTPRGVVRAEDGPEGPVSTDGPVGERGVDDILHGTVPRVRPTEEPPSLPPAEQE